MSFLNKRFSFELAQPEDSKEILEILETNDFKGAISLLYTRRPDAYASFKQEGNQVEILVCRDQEKNILAGVAAYAVRNLFVNGEITPVAYLFALRSYSDYFKTFRLLHKGYAYLHSLLESQSIPFYITTILEDNLYTQRLLEKKRSFMPTYEFFGSYEMYALKLEKKKHHRSNFTFKQAEKSDLPQLVAFLQTEGKHYQFFPVLTEQDLTTGIYPGVSWKHFYILRSASDEWLAVGALWDQQSYKQYVVQAYGGILKWCYPLSGLFPLFGLPTLPKPASILNFFTLSFWIVKHQDPFIFHTFLDYLSTHVRNYPFFLVGVHERNPLRTVLIKRPHITYRSRFYLVDWEKKQRLLQRLDKQYIPYLECGML